MSERIIREGIRWLDDAIGDEEEDAAAVRLRDLLRRVCPEYKVGDEVSWIHVTRTGFMRTQGPILDFEGELAIVIRGKRGKKKYKVHINDLHPKDGDPLRSLVSAMREGMVERGEVRG